MSGTTVRSLIRHGDLATGIFAPPDSNTIKYDLRVFHVGALKSFM